MNTITKLTLFLFVLILGCKANIPSTKDSEYISRLANSTIRLNLFSNGMFYYRSSGDLINLYSFGKWKKVENNLVLQSDEIYKNTITFVNECTSSDSKTIRIKISDINDLPIESAIIIINNKKELSYSTNENGLVEIPNMNLEKINVLFLNNKYEYSCLNKEINVFDLKIKLEDSNTYYLDNETWIIKNNKIISPDNRIFKKR